MRLHEQLMNRNTPEVEGQSKVQKFKIISTRLKKLQGGLGPMSRSVSYSARKIENQGSSIELPPLQMVEEGQSDQVVMGEKKEENDGV